MQTLGGSISLSIGHLIFEDRLVASIHRYAPAVDAAEVINAGAYSFPDVVSSDHLPGVFRAYAEAFDKTMYVAVVASAAMFVCAWGMGWHSIKDKKTEAVEESS